MAHGVGRHRSSLTSELVQRAITGDQSAWDVLVERYSGMLWSIARAHGIGTGDAMDVVQTTWLRLVENVDSVRDPDRVGAWLAVTARRESLRVLRLRSREHACPADLSGTAGVSGLAGAAAPVWPVRADGDAAAAFNAAVSGPHGGSGAAPIGYEPGDPQDVAVARERQQLLITLIGRLPERCRRLIRMLTTVPPASYAEISAALDMPIGSIGPTRARCLAQIRKRLAGRKS